MQPVRYFLFGLICLLAHTAAAADTPGGFSAEATGTQTFSYDSNPLRVESGAESLYGSTTSPRLILRNKTPTAAVEADTRIDANFFNHSEYDSVDLHEKLLLSKENERWTAAVRGLADYDTTRTSELTNYSLNLPKVRRTKLTAAPQITFRPNPRDSLSLNAAITGVEYDNDVYTDYRMYSVSPSFEHRFDPQNKGSVAFNAQRYETTSTNSLTSDSYGPTLGWTSQLNPRLTSTLTAGAQATEKSGSNAGSDHSSWNYIFSAKLAYKGSEDAIDFTATRAREPFGNGTETLLTTAGVKERHTVNPTLALTAHALYQNADYTTEPGRNLDHGVSTGAGVIYKWNQNLDLTADYKFRNETLTHTNDTVDQHIVMVGFVIHPFSDQP